MARFDVHANPDGPGWLLDLQTDLLDGLNTRIVAPLFPPDEAPEPARRLNPVLRPEGTEAVMLTQFMAAVPVSALGKPVDSLAADRDTIVAALDMLFDGI